VAPEQGTALSTTATDRSDPIRNCRAIVNPMIPAPMITTSKVREDADITASGRSIRVDIEMEPNKLVLDPKAKLPDCLLGDEKRRSCRGWDMGGTLTSKPFCSWFSQLLISFDSNILSRKKQLRVRVCSVLLKQNVYHAPGCIYYY
jgi:hypothetical protein